MLDEKNAVRIDAIRLSFSSSQRLGHLPVNLRPFELECSLAFKGMSRALVLVPTKRETQSLEKQLVTYVLKG